jgi:V/A-type H+-transporting ATPase subunit C
MALGNVTQYAAIDAHVRAMYSTMLTDQEFSLLLEAPDLDSVIELLKNTAYRPYLERVNDKELTARRAAYQIRERLADTYTIIINAAPAQTKPLLIQLYRHFEVTNLKAVLRGVVAGSTWDQVRFLLFPFGPTGVLPAEAMIETHNVASAVELLQGTPYYDTLSFAMKRYSAEGTLFPLEVALDLSYWRDLWDAVKHLKGADRNQAMRILGPYLDSTNLMWAIRYRVYHHLSEEEIVNYTLPFGYHVSDEAIRSIAAGADISMVVASLYPDLPNIDVLLDNPASGLQELELLLQRKVVAACRAVFMGDPFNIGIPIGYLTLFRMEVQDLTVLFEEKATGIKVDNIRRYLMIPTAEGRQ